MNTHQRRDLIAQKVLEQGRIHVSDLVQEFGMTDTSIRNDLTILEERGLLRRIHGGAVSTNRSIQLAAYDTRLGLQREPKVHIAAAAADRLHSADIALLDSGTSIQYLARQIPARGAPSGRLRIVTNSIPVLEEIGGWASHNLLMLGGIFLPEHQATVGPETLRGLQQFNATCAFLGCDGLTLEGGITSAHPLVAEVGRVMAERAEEVIVLADSSKLGQAGFVPIIPLGKINVLITDAGAPSSHRRRASATGRRSAPGGLETGTMIPLHEADCLNVSLFEEAAMPRPISKPDLFPPKRLRRASRHVIGEQSSWLGIQGRLYSLHHCRSHGDDRSDLGTSRTAHHMAGNLWAI